MDTEKPFVLVSLFSNKTSFYVTAPLHASHPVAETGDWAAYVMAMGGAILPRCNRPIHPYYETKKNETVDIETGEIIQNNLTYYGDVRAPSLRGLINKNIINLTRTRTWTKIKQPMTTCGSKNESGNKELVKLHPIPIPM